MEKKIDRGELLGGISASLVALPSAIAFGLIIYSPLGPAFSSKGVIAGILGAVILGIIAALLSGTPRMISAPCAPAAAVLSVFSAEMLSRGIPENSIPGYLLLVAAGAGLVQLLFGMSRGGAFIKYIPYPVVAGYLGAVGTLIILGQVPKFFGLGTVKGLSPFLSQLPLAHWESIVIGTLSIIVMVYGPRVIKSFPAPILALLSGVVVYFCISIFQPELRTLENNKFVIGTIQTSIAEVGVGALANFQSLLSIEIKNIGEILVPILTLGVLLSIDSLKTCVLLDVLTGYRHNSNQELIAQGLGNFATSLCGGIPGGGTTGPTLVNLYSGGKTQISSLISGLTSLAILLVLSPFLSWIPISSLAGVLLVIGFRMIDTKSFLLLKHRSTRFDFIVILSVVFSAITFSLITAAGVGIAFAIALFLREQIRFSVVRHLTTGNKISSKKTRTPSEIKILNEEGEKVVVLELQGQLFFGTTDQLYKEIEPYLKKCKFFILDMRRVLSIDFTASNMLLQIRKKISENNGIFIFSNVPLSVPTGKNLMHYLENFGFSGAVEGVEVFPELSDAIEWVEDKILVEKNYDTDDTPYRLEDFDFFEDISSEALKTLSSGISRKVYQRGDKIFNIGDMGGEIYFISSGNIRIEVPLPNGSTAHRATFAKGGFFGDMSFLDNQNRSANAVVSSVDAILFVLSRDKFHEIIKNYPEVGIIFYEKLAYQLSLRMRTNVMELTNLQE